MIPDDTTHDPTGAPPRVSDPRVVHARISDEPLDPAALERLVTEPRVGAVTTFTGRVRDHDPQAAGEVVALDYSCHPDAERALHEVAADVLAEHDPQGGTRVAVAHRIGRLEVGDPAIVVAVAAAHRAVTFAVCEALVEQVKARVPVWKHQREADGRATWSNLGVS